MGLIKRLFYRRHRTEKAAGLPQSPSPVAETAAPTGPSVKPGDVILLGGGRVDDDKQKWKSQPHLGKSATVVSARDSLFVEVRVNNESKEQQTISWPKSQVSSLTRMLSDDILTEVFSYLGESDASRAIFARRKETQYYDDDSDTNNKRPFFAITTIRDVARLHHKLGRVCKHWRAVCDDRLASIQGLVDADLIPSIGCNQLVLPALQWMCRHKLRVRSIRLTNAKSHAPYIRTMLRKQDTTHLKELHLSFGLVHVSDESLAEAIVEECKDLNKLHIQYGGDGTLNQARHEVTPAYKGLSIQELVLDLDDTTGHLSQWVKLIPEMQSLQHLRCLGAKWPCSYRSRHVQIKSDSLITLDVREFHGGWVFCQCPKLESYSCTSALSYRMFLGAMGGSLPVFSSNDQFAAFPSSDARNRVMEVTAGSMPFLGVNVPPSCTIILQKLSHAIERHVYGFNGAQLSAYGPRRGYHEYMTCLQDLQQCLEDVTTTKVR